MGALREILDTIRDLSTVGAGSVEDVFKRKKHSSLSRKSLEGTMQFPAIVSKSLDIDTLQMVSKALERQYASFVQVSLTMNPLLDLSKDKDAQGYLRKFHQNSNMKTSAADLQNFGASLLESYDGFANENKDVVMFSTVTEGATGQIVALNKQQLGGLLEGIREDSLNSRFVPRPNTYKFKNDNYGAYHNSVKEAAGGPVDRNPDTTIPSQILKDNDVKKSNELVPTTMHVRTHLLSREGRNEGHMDFVVGVKTTMHPVSSDEMVSNMLAGAKSKSQFFNSIRWTSGEIGFFKDFVLNLQDIKKDVTDRSAGASPWWISLKRRRALAKLKGALMLPNQILPNATIVVSMEEVEYIKSEFGYDLMDTKFVDKIMDQYFLLGFVVVDNSTQITHFLFDGHNDFQSVSFNGLERDAKGGNGVDFKDVLKLVQRV